MIVTYVCWYDSRTTTKIVLFNLLQKEAGNQISLHIRFSYSIKSFIQVFYSCHSLNDPMRLYLLMIGFNYSSQWTAMLNCRSQKMQLRAARACISVIQKGNLLIKRIWFRYWTLTPADRKDCMHEIAPTHSHCACTSNFDRLWWMRDHFLTRSHRPLQYLGWRKAAAFERNSFYFGTTWVSEILSLCNKT